LLAKVAAEKEQVSEKFIAFIDACMSECLVRLKRSKLTEREISK
jgi:hypothetical protein